MRPREAFVVSVARGMLISGILIPVLPALLGASFIWYAMPITEVLPALYAFLAIRRNTAALPRCDTQEYA